MRNITLVPECHISINLGC